MSISVPQNFFKETVATAWTTGAGNFYVSTKPTVTAGYLVISPENSSLREIVKFTAVGTDGGGDYVTIASASDRGLGGTTEQTHEVQEKVYMNITAENIQELSDAIDQIVAAGAQDASSSVKGIVKLSTSPVSASEPIAVGSNDTTILPTSDEKDALAGTSGSPSSSNKYVTNDDTSTSGTTGKIIRADGTGLPIGVTKSVKGLSVSGSTTDLAQSSTSQYDLYSVSVPANSLGTSNAVRIKMYIQDFTHQSSSGVVNFRLLYGSTVIATATFSAHTAGTINLTGWIEAVVIGAGTTSSQIGTIMAHFQTGSTDLDSPTATRNLHAFDTGTASEDSTSALNFKIAAFTPTNAADLTDLQPAGIIVEHIS